MRIRGCTFDQIAKAIGSADPSGAYHIVKQALAASLSEPAEELRRIEDRRLDRSLKKVEAALRVAQPEQVAALVSTLLRIQERRARLHGLDAPKRVEVSTPRAIPIHYVNDWRGAAGPEPIPETEPDAGT